MDIAEIKELIKVIDASKLTTFEMEQDGIKLLMKKEIAVSSVVSTVVSENVDESNDEVIKSAEKAITGKTVNSPMVGTFYASSAPDKPPFVQVGDKVKKRQVICIVEAMKLMNEIESDMDGEIAEILVNNEDMLEYGQPMFVIK